MRLAAVIPARFQSTRLPAKPLLKIADRPLIEWVWRSVKRAEFLDRVLVATDDRRILEAVRQFGGEAVMTRPDHTSGTLRVAEVAESLDADVVINVQGDVPLVAVSTIESVCRPFQEPDVQVVTACVEIEDSREIASPHVVKVVTGVDGRALYFSRSPIPYGQGGGTVYKHLGIYAYRRLTLFEIARLKPSPLELSEGLEQLRWLENGVPIRVAKVAQDSIEVDTPEDLKRVTPLLENRLQDTDGSTGKGSKFRCRQNSFS